MPKMDLVLRKVREANDKIPATDQAKLLPRELAMLQGLCEKLADTCMHHSVIVEQAEVDLLCGKMARDPRHPAPIVLDLARTMTMVASAVPKVRPHGRSC